MVKSPIIWLDTKTYWLTDRQLQCDSDSDSGNLRDDVDLSGGCVVFNLLILIFFVVCFLFLIPWNRESAVFLHPESGLSAVIKYAFWCSNKRRVFLLINAADYKVLNNAFTGSSGHKG
jgi:hypothetical protein